MILRKNIPRALTVEEPGDIGGGRSFGLAGDCRIFPVESGHVSRRVDQNGRRGCEMRKGAGLDRNKNVHVRLNGAILRSAPLLYCIDDHSPLLHPRSIFRRILEGHFTTLEQSEGGREGGTYSAKTRPIRTRYSLHIHFPTKDLADNAGSQTIIFLRRRDTFAVRVYLNRNFCQLLVLPWDQRSLCQRGGQNWNGTSTLIVGC